MLDCLEFGGDWIEADFHWNNIGSSIFNLFIIATSEGWNSFMFSAWFYKTINCYNFKGML